MRLARLGRSILLAPWHLLVFLFYLVPRSLLLFAGRLLLSARAWVLFFLCLIALLVTYFALSNRYTPFTTDAYIQTYVVQVAAQVEGQVVRVYVKENQEVRKGELMFEIDPRPFNHRVALLEAKLVHAKNQVEQMETEVTANKAEETRLVAEEAYALAVFKQEAAIFKQESTTERRYLDAVQKHKAAKALLEKSRAAVKKSRQALEAIIGDEHAVVAEVKAQLADSRLNLEWTRINAPCNGYVTNVQLREGSYVRVGTPVLTCIDADQFWVTANFRENSLEWIKPGQAVGLTLNTHPGQVFTGTVQSVGWGVSEGQGVPSGELPTVRNPRQWIRLPQRFQVRIAPELPPDYKVRVGSTVSATVYTSADNPLNPVAEAWQRVVTWFDYLY